ncbi:MAG: DUF362 domain-containing protein [Nitrospiraceae bacterium]|nr:MAG: DUF362 domain-containing protein [Nitrospiraceae bacterium]
MINRREFMIGTPGIFLSAIAGGKEKNGPSAAKSPSRSKTVRSTISLVKTSDRQTGIKKAIELLGMNPVKGRDVLLKPNFNTADRYPGSTHNDTLINLILYLRHMGAKSITIGERSGPPDTADVLEQKGIYSICKDVNVKLVNFEELPEDEWVKVKPEGSHWRNGFYVAKPVLDSECIVSTCCLKTHGYGGVFTMSLKLSVGIVHKRNMTELHSSFLSMRKMIAEINQAYRPSLILLDGIEAFTDRGPMEGTRKRADVIIAGTDRIAIDAAGLAVLKDLSSNRAIMEKKIFDQEQIARAVELGLGVAQPADIEIITGDDESSRYAERLQSILLKG